MSQVLAAFRHPLAMSKPLCTRSKTRGVIAGLVPAISIRMAQCLDYRDGRDIRAFTPVFDGLLPGHDQAGLPRVLPLLRRCELSTGRSGRI